ncbi:yqjG [Scenedesmus sp. PABB004]|nr:yqjG [Scenedesmus sp. PABB004]
MQLACQQQRAPPAPGGAATRAGARRPPRTRAAAVAVRAAAQQPQSGLSLLTWTSKLVPQGALVSGAKAGWRLAWETMVRELAPQDAGGGYARPGYAFDEQIGSARFPAESGRYHVYVGNACPWCSRVLLALAVTGLSRHVGVGWLADVPERATRGGWIFEAPDPVTGAHDLWGVYDALSPGFRGRCTAPLLIDAAARPRAAVSNESASIVRMLARLSLPGTPGVELVPAALEAEIDALNDQVYRSVNNGVYRCGFATTQAAYDAAAAELHGALASLDGRLGRTRFLLGDKFTEADLRLFPTIVRFDAVYAGIFRCGRRRVADYANLQAWMRDVWQIKVPGGGLQVSDAIDVDGCRRSYYSNLFPLNPSSIVPSGPTAADLGLDVPAGRGGHALAEVFHLRAGAGGA